MNITIDEFLAVLQSDEDGKKELEEVTTKQAKQRYSKRFDGVYRGSEVNTQQVSEQMDQLENMKYNEFDYNRRYQMFQLYSAYIAKEHSRKIMPRATDENSVRRVIGPYAGRGVVYSGNMFLDNNTISATESVAETIKKKGDHGVDGPSSISIWQLSNIVDEMIACNEILNKDRKKTITINSMIHGTNVAKRAIGKILQYNVFGIEDFHVTAEQTYSRKRSIIAKIIGAIEQKMKPKQEPARLGDELLEK